MRSWRQYGLCTKEQRAYRQCREDAGKRVVEHDASYAWAFFRGRYWYGLEGIEHTEHDECRHKPPELEPRISNGEQEHGEPRDCLTVHFIDVGLVEVVRGFFACVSLALAPAGCHEVFGRANEAQSEHERRHDENQRSGPVVPLPHEHALDGEGNEAAHETAAGSCLAENDSWDEATEATT